MSNRDPADSVIESIAETYVALVRDAWTCAQKERVSIDKLIKWQEVDPDPFEFDAHIHTGYVWDPNLAYLRSIAHEKLSRASDQRRLVKVLKRMRHSFVSSIIEEKERAERAKYREGLKMDETAIRRALADLVLIAGQDELLLAGLAVVVKDTEQELDRLAAPPRIATSAPEEGDRRQRIEVECLQEDAQLFREVLDQLKAEDEKLPRNERYDAVVRDRNLPAGIVGKAWRNVQDLSTLASKAIITKATLRTGKRLYRLFSAKLRANICGDGGVYKEFRTGRLKPSLPVAVVNAVLLGGFSESTFWYPLAIYLGLLIAKSGLEAFCETPRSRTTKKSSRTTKKK